LGGLLILAAEDPAAPPRSNPMPRFQHLLLPGADQPPDSKKEKALAFLLGASERRKRKSGLFD